MGALTELTSYQESRILDLAWDGIFLLGLDGTIQLWNRGAEEMYGWKREEVFGRISHQLLMTRFPYPLACIMDELTERGQWNGELGHTTKSGRELIVSARWTIQRDGDGRPCGFLEINRDITQQKRLEREQARLAALVESSEDAIISKGLDGTIETWNRAAEQMYGYTSAEAVGKPITIIVPPDRAEEEASILSRIRAGERIPHFDTVRLRKDGSSIDISLMIFPLRDASGAITGASHVARDISDRMRYQREIRALNESLERRVEERTGELNEVNRELESFSYSVSHDLRAPIRSIDGFSRLVLEQSPGLDEKARDRLRRIVAASGRMGQLIDALLDLARLSQTEMRHERVGLSTLASHVANELTRSHPDRNVSFAIQPGLATRGDPRLLRVLLENLLGNAFKFSGENPEARIEFGAYDENGRPVYYVRDNGVGFDMQYAGQLFAPFQRLHAKSEFEGTGIGLATVHRIVVRHGGRIWADAAPGKGATFFFTLTSGNASDAK